MKARTHLPPRGTPYQSYLATQARKSWLKRAAWFILALVLVLIGAGRIGA